MTEVTLAEWLRGIVANQQALAKACGVDLPFSGEYMEGIKLPAKLQATMLHAEAFDMAVEKGYIEMTEEGHLAWMLGNSTLLAYFLGRLFSGDYGKYSKGKDGTLWVRGEKVFPATELQQLFQLFLRG